MYPLHSDNIPYDFCDIKKYIRNKNSTKSITFKASQKFQEENYMELNEFFLY